MACASRWRRSRRSWSSWPRRRGWSTGFYDRRRPARRTAPRRLRSLGGMIPRRGEGELPEVYARLWRVVAGAQGPVSCKDCCREFDLGFEPRAVEGMRGKLKRLVERGRLIEPSPGRFTGAAAVRPVSEP
jgi:hypothetical protein